MAEYEIKIPAGTPRQRVDQVAAELIGRTVSRSQLHKHGTFWLKKSPTSPRLRATSAEFSLSSGKAKVVPGQEWKIILPENTAPVDLTTAWDFPLEIIAESDTWLAIDKPAGISVHPSVSEPTNQTIVNALLHRFGAKKLSENSAEIDGLVVPKPGIVHRLDKPTSGVLLVAKTNETHRFLQEHWSDVTKIYTAIVIGIPPRHGKISAGIMRDPADRTRMTTSNSEKAREAVTHFERVSVSSDQKYSRLRIQIPTGRTHQIRVHLSSIGFAIIGDEKYGKIHAERLMLHATELHFPDPDKGEGKTELITAVPKIFDRWCV